MSWYKQSQEQPVDFNPNVEVPALVSPPNPLDGKTPAQARSFANKAIPHDLIKGFFSDDSWQGVQQIWTALNQSGLNWNISESNYYPTSDGHPMGGKNWGIEVHYTDKKGKPAKIYGNVTAAGAGSVENPLERYDVVAYFL
jgi:hypothetical protein